MFVIYVTGSVQKLLNILSAVDLCFLVWWNLWKFYCIFQSEELVFTPEVLLLLLLLFHRRRRRRNVFCITIRYGLDVPGIECAWGRNFPYRSPPVQKSTQPPVNGCRVLGVKQPERGESVCEWVGLLRSPLLCLFRYVTDELYLHTYCCTSPVPPPPPPQCFSVTFWFPFLSFHRNLFSHSP